MTYCVQKLICVTLTHPLIKEHLIIFPTCLLTEAAARRCPAKENGPKNFAKSTEKHLRRSSFLNKLVGWRPVTLLKKRLRHNFQE